jgi:hypothetical protein
MPRILKLQELETLIDRDTGERATLYFDRNYNDFVAKIGTEEVRDKTADGCKAKARAMLKAFKPYEWKQYIFVEEVKDRTHYGHSGRGRYDYRAKVSFSFFRNEMAQKKDGHWLERPFLEDWLSDSDREPTRQNWGNEMYIPTAEALARCRKENKTRRADGSDIETSGYKEQQGGSSSSIILPYTEETWLALKVMHQKLLDFEKQLDSFTKSKDFEKKLFSVAKNLKLLPEKT